jgi:hypothetical protein
MGHRAGNHAGQQTAGLVARNFLSSIFVSAAAGSKTVEPRMAHTLLSNKIKPGGMHKLILSKKGPWNLYLPVSQRVSKRGSSK